MRGSIYSGSYELSIPNIVYFVGIAGITVDSLWNEKTFPYLVFMEELRRLSTDKKCQLFLNPQLINGVML